eukprot:2016186-Amphidinium_carterae.2
MPATCNSFVSLWMQRPAKIKSLVVSKPSDKGGNMCQQRTADSLNRKPGPAPRVSRLERGAKSSQAVVGGSSIRRRDHMLRSKKAQRLRRRPPCPSPARGHKQDGQIVYKQTTDHKLRSLMQEDGFQTILAIMCTINSGKTSVLVASINVILPLAKCFGGYMFQDQA